MKIVLRYGLFAVLTLAGLNLLGIPIFGTDPESFRVQEVYGYASILLAMSLIFFAVRRYREEVAAGAFGFGKALAVGLATDLLASVLYGLFMALYLTQLQPDFLPTYLEWSRAQIQASGEPPAEIARQLKELADMEALYLNPLFQSLVMFATVFVVGAAVSLVSALLLRRRDSGG